MELTLLHYGLLTSVGIVAGIINAIAGGGTYLTFPLLIFTGLPPLLANTTNKVAIWFGSLGSISGYWSEIKHHSNGQLWLLVGIGVFGSITGSLLLLIISNEVFNHIVPWLMLFATITFTFGSQITTWAKQQLGSHGSIGQVGIFLNYLGQFVVTIYGGFFGAGMNIVLLALYELMGIKSIHHMNGLKALVGLAVNAVSALTFIILGQVVWLAAIALLTGTMLGGYIGASVAKCLPSQLIRLVVIIYASIVTILFFIL